MWNSWVDYEVIEKIKETASKYYSWFFLRQFKNDKDRNRMENEELFTSLIFLEYYRNRTDNTKKIFDIYQKFDRINARIGDKLYITNLLNEVNEHENVKRDFHDSIKRVEAFIKKIKFIVLDTDKNKEELFSYLREELDSIYRGGKELKSFRRTLQDFYILWYMLNDINLEMIKFHRLEIKKEVRQLFTYSKNIPEEELKGNLGFERFKKKVIAFKIKYQKDERKIRLSEDEKLAKIKEQDNKSPISGAPIFLGDDIEPDHTTPIAIGGKDSIENIQMTHKDENRSKGARSL